MPIAHPQAQCAAARNPVVVMTKSEALALSASLNLSRTYIVADIARIGRSRSMTDAAKRHDVACLRDALDALVKFQAAHEEAHGLGGY